MLRGGLEVLNKLNGREEESEEVFEDGVRRPWCLISTTTRRLRDEGTHLNSNQPIDASYHEVLLTTQTNERQRGRVFARPTNINATLEILSTKGQTTPMLHMFEHNPRRAPWTDTTPTGKSPSLRWGRPDFAVSHVAPSATFGIIQRGSMSR